MPKASPIPRARKQEISYENVNAGMTVSPGGLTTNTDTDPEEPFVVVLYCSIKKAT